MLLLRSKFLQKVKTLKLFLKAVFFREVNTGNIPMFSLTPYCLVHEKSPYWTMWGTKRWHTVLSSLWYENLEELEQRQQENVLKVHYIHA